MKIILHKDRKNPKITNHEGTRTVEDGEVKRITNNETEQFRLNFSNRSTVTELL